MLDRAKKRPLRGLLTYLASSFLEKDLESSHGTAYRASWNLCLTSFRNLPEYCMKLVFKSWGKKYIYNYMYIIYIVNVPSICIINSCLSHGHTMIHMVPLGASNTCRPLRRQCSWAGGRIQQGQQNRVLHLRIGG